MSWIAMPGGARLFGKSRQQVKQAAQGGEVLHCLHARNRRKGAVGHGLFRLRGARSAFGPLPGKPHRAPTGENGADAQRPARPWWNLRVSCQPFTYGRSAFILLILEGLND